MISVSADPKWQTEQEIEPEYTKGSGSKRFLNLRRGTVGTVGKCRPLQHRQ